MNYNGNMPDWHQYNPVNPPPQSGINDVTSSTQNVNPGHLPFISSISPTCSNQLNILNLSSEGLEKHQNDPNFNPRHFQPHLSNNISHGHNATDNNPLASMVQMQNCIGHYGPSNTRNPMDNSMNGPVDPRNAAIGSINDELGYRNNQVPLNGPMSHLNGPNVMNMNVPHASIGRNTNVTSHANRTGPSSSFVPCKALCCSDSNIGYQQWEKYCSYQNNASYRENIRSSASYPTDARRFANEYNFRKDNFEGKEILSTMVPPSNGPNADHRRNFHYRKDRLFSRSYSSSSNMLQNYSMQNYNNYGEYQKYPYNSKNIPMNGMNVANQGMMKHPEQNFTIPQQKYNKQVPYQTSGAMIPTSMPSTSVPNPSMIPPVQNTYFNSQYSRNLTADATHDCQETTDSASIMNRMQTNATNIHTPSHPRYQMYQQKIAMQRFSMENNLRELARIPGYQSHPKYKECVHKYREILKLQQSVTYQGQIQQQNACATASTINTCAIPSINLQFDQNGVLINPNYMSEVFPRVQQTVNSQVPMDSSVEKQDKQDDNNKMMNCNIQKPEQLISQQRDNHVSALCVENIQKQDQYSMQKSLNQNQFEVQKGNDNFDNLTGNEDGTVIQQKKVKEFADKPELDVRQFLANWDESEDEDNANTSLPSTVLSESTPIVVVGYENIGIAAKTLEGLEVSKSEEITPRVITFKSQEKSDINVVPTQDCLISYSATENIEIARDPKCKDITKEAVIQPGSHIIQCISNGPDEVPTIHIVDNLEVGSILQVTNGQVTETVKGQDAVPFFQEKTEVEVTTITLQQEADKNSKIDVIQSITTEYNTDLENMNKKEYIVETTPSSKIAEGTLQTSRMGAEEIIVLPTSAKDITDNANLKKQSSFASEESHNPDDISLPDLATSECTPISTTLNTPIHSDNEESPQRVEDLNISTNPIEIIQNSPIISFTQSPTKSEPYDHLNSEETKNKSVDSLEGEYRTEDRFKNSISDKNVLGHDILNKFEFSPNTDKNKSLMSTKSDNEYTNLNETSISINSNDNETGTNNATDGCMTLNSEEYELKIVPLNKSEAYKNLISERDTESPITKADACKKSQTEMNQKVVLWYSDSTKTNNTSQNVVELDNDQNDVNYSRKKCALMEKQTITTTSKIISSSTNDIHSENFEMEKSSCTEIIKNDLSELRNTNLLDNDKLRKSKASCEKEDSLSEKIISANVDAKDPENSKNWRTKLENCKGDQTLRHKERHLSENTKEKCDKIIIHHNKHAEETMNKDKSHVDNLKSSDNLHDKPKVIENISIIDNEERMRFLKKYRRIKHKPLNVDQVHDKDKDKALDHAKKHHLSNLDAELATQSPCVNQGCQKDVTETKPETENQTNILKTFVTKNVTPEFAIQVKNVNLKLKDDDNEKRLQHLKEETKGSSSLDAIKIEINVSCTERNTTEKFLHENIKNAVAETIGHLTNSLSNGTRSNLTEIQYEKKMICDKIDCGDYENPSRSPFAVKETSTCNEAHKDTEIKFKTTIAACKKDSETLILKKKRNSLSEQRVIDTYENNDASSNTCAEPSNSDVVLRNDTDYESIPNVELKNSKSERTKNTRQEIEKATDFCSEELKVSSDNLQHLGSKNVQRKEDQETAIASCVRNLQDTNDTIASRLIMIPSTSSMARANLEDINSKHFNYDHFDIDPKRVDIDDKYITRWRRPKREDNRFDNFDLYNSGYVNPIFFNVNKLENLNTVPVYTTKDGKITYSPNPRFTYRELIMEARTKNDYESSCEQYFAKSPSYNYYNCSKLRKIFKKNRNRKEENKKREIDSIEAKFTTNVDYLLNKNSVHKNVSCTKTRGTSRLEFFNDDADKLYVNRSDQESKESTKKIAVDLNFLEKRYDLDSEFSSTIKQYKTKMVANNLEYEKEYNQSTILDSNLFLEPKGMCWEETMESIKSYSSHIERRTDDKKIMNFSEVFVSQRRLDSFPLLPTEQESPDNSNKNRVTKEPTLHQVTYDYIDDLDLIQNDDSRREQSDVVPSNEQEKENNNQGNADINDKSISTLNRLSNNVENNDDDPQKQESQLDGDELGMTERAQSCSPEIDETHDGKEDQNSICYVENKEALTKHPSENDLYLHCSISSKEDTSNVEDVNKKNDCDENLKITSPFKVDIESNLFDEPKSTETEFVKESTSSEQNDNSAKDDSVSTVNQETICQQELLSTSINYKDEKEDTSLMKSNVSTENFNQTNEQSVHNKKDLSNLTSKKDEPIVLQNSSDIMFIERIFDESNEQQLKTSENNEEKGLLENEENEVDCPSISTSAVALNVRTKENVCDLFACEKREQNISEFTVIKNIIEGDKKQYQESKTNENLENCDSIIDSKLLCMDSSDCGIYAEDKCALTHISGHDFAEDDSMVPMIWETSQIQEDAVNRLCSIDETIDFAGAVNSLRDNSLLDHLSLSKITVSKESQVAETITQVDKAVPIVKSTATTEEPRVTSNKDGNNDGDNEQNQISSSSYEKIAYLHAVDCNANTKMVPKLVIKKSDTSSRFITKMGSSSVIEDSAVKPVCQPKIPKMIIRNARSRPGTPSIEAVHEESPAHPNSLDRTLFKNEDLCDGNSESSSQELNKNKIPKMKIKLDEKHASKIMKTDNAAKICVKRKYVKRTVPKMKIRNASRPDLINNSISKMPQDSKSPERYKERIPILKLKKQNNRASSPEVIRKRQNSSYLEAPVKKYKRSGRDEIEYSMRSNNSSDPMRMMECETKKNSLMHISEKIPKVIIKRTSANAEFKCELSKSSKNVAKSAKWQPEVKLERYQILDNMVKDLKLTLSPITLRAIDKMFTNHKDDYRQGKQDDHKLSRSNSTSNLFPAKFKQRRMSDYDCSKIDNTSEIRANFASFSHTNSRDTKTGDMPKKNVPFKNYKSIDDKDNKLSRSHDDSQVKTSSALYDKETNELSKKANLQKAFSQSDKRKIDNFDITCDQDINTDEDTDSNKIDQKNTFKHSANSDDKPAPKELKTTSKIETCFVKLIGLNKTSLEEDHLQTNLEQKKEQNDDSFLNKNDNKIVIKKEHLNINNMDNDCTLQDNTDLLKNESTSMLDNFEINKSNIIKIESSDESQSTIEILPASPDNNHNELEKHIVKDDDVEEIYSADAIPTQFELELEINDNSTDLLDTSMPKLNPIVSSNSCRASEESSNQTAKLERHNEAKAFSCSKNSPVKDKHIVDGDNGDNGSIVHSVGSIEEAFSKVPYCKIADTATKESFWCSDSLVKEVLAAKETLKKCLSKSIYDVQNNAIDNIKSKMTTEKQSSNFNINNVPEMPSRNASQDSDIAFQRNSMPMVNKHNKTEDIHNVDKDHSKQSKISFVENKVRSSEKNSESVVKDTPECNVISLKTFKQFNQTTSNEKFTCTVRLNEKRKNETSQNENVSHKDVQEKNKNQMPHKIPKILKSTDQNDVNITKEIKEDNMPILEPEVNVNIDTNSDREISRSPPVITIQNSEDLDAAESKLMDDKIITSSIKVDSNTQDFPKKSEMSIVDFISQLAYHEKATIKHRRYCNLCERWFPTTSRHRRHLTGYQHRHIELTQRRSIHALFTLFTGKPCPRLVPANVVRNDCSVGELTPLQIAVQDVTKCFGYIQQKSPKKENDVDK